MRGAAGPGRAGYRYALTDLGRDRAGHFLELSRYIGPAPVPLAQYIAYMRALHGGRGYLDRERWGRLHASRRRLRHARAARPGGELEQVALPLRPSGQRQDDVAEGIGRALGGEIYIPYAMDVDGQIITMFDPVNHLRADNAANRTNDRRRSRPRSPLGEDPAAPSSPSAAS